MSSSMTPTSSVSAGVPSSVPNFTDLGLGGVGPAIMGPGVDFPHKGSACSGNAYNVTTQCCDSVGGYTNVTPIECDAVCCDKFAVNKSICPKGYYGATWCILPKSANESDWKTCYDLGTKGMTQQSIFACVPPNSGAVQHNAHLMLLAIVLGIAVACLH